MKSLVSIKIENPIWGTKSVGIAEYKICDVNFIEIMSTDKYGNRVYPKLFKATREQLMKGEVQYTKNGNVKLRVVPIASLELVDEVE